VQLHVTGIDPNSPHMIARRRRASYSWVMVASAKLRRVRARLTGNG
jgi:hypothetical protein